MSTNRTIIEVARRGRDGDYTGSADVAALQANMNTVQPAALSSKSRVLDLADYLDITGTADGTSGLQSALNDAAGAVNAAGGAPELFLRGGGSIKLSGSIVVPNALRNGFSLIGGGPLGGRITATTAAPAFILDPSTTPANATRRLYWRMENLAIYGPGAGVSGSIGVLANNALQGGMTNVVVREFETGVKVDALNLVNGTAAYYNTFVNLQSRFNGIGLHLGVQSNANTFYGGMIAGNSTGLFIEGGNTVGNQFFGTNIESNSAYGARIQGNRNYLICYWENASPSKDVWFDGTANRNVIDGFMSSAADRITWDAAKNNVVRRPGNLHLGTQQTGDSYSLYARRNTAKSDEAHIELEDSFSGSGNPIGVRYRTQRRTERAFHSQFSPDGGTTYYDTWKLGNHPTANFPWLQVGDGASATVSQIRWITGDPNGSQTGRVGDICIRKDGGAGTVLYIKETGNGTNTGWVGK